MNREGKKCVIYLRVSTEMQIDGFSLDGQRTGLTKFAEREGMSVVKIYEDAGKSGKSIEGRPSFQRMLTDIYEGLKVDYVLVYKLSRFGRNAADILNSLEFIQSYDVNLICIDEGIDSSQTSGKLLISILSAVAEIERENIIEQTMNGRREKARQGLWNGGFAPYGYVLEHGKIYIVEEEAEAIKKIFELFSSTRLGLGGVAKYLNYQGIKKVAHHNGYLELWTPTTIKRIIDNPIYYGKIAFGRRGREKIKGTKNQYRTVNKDNYILADGQHEAIIDEELWQKAHKKRLKTGVANPPRFGKNKAHLLTGILRCPKCGGPMYANRNTWIRRDGTLVDRYYYYCSHKSELRGKICGYRRNIQTTDIEPYVIETIRKLIKSQYFSDSLKECIGAEIDTTLISKEIRNFDNKLKEVIQNKMRLENELDNLPLDEKYRDKKIENLNRRIYALYDVMADIEEKIEVLENKKRSIEENSINSEKIYSLICQFDELYDIISEEEKKQLLSILVNKVEIYSEENPQYPIKSIEFSFAIPSDGETLKNFLWDNEVTDESIVLLTKKN